ncbi:hypothetical protein GGI1_17353 [Acidithiobacillus sp. GGI-221]|nr:hypothetical protein GGI1_17353 [Acidithiobacillus sp. GGI-221]
MLVTFHRNSDKVNATFLRTGLFPYNTRLAGTGGAG